MRLKGDVRRRKMTPPDGAPTRSLTSPAVITPSELDKSSIKSPAGICPAGIVFV
jgi:hypothetical protein